MKEKQTPTEFEIHPLIKNRWSPRAFANKPIAEKDIKVLLEAGRWAPSSNNLQPWRIIWGIKGTETYDRIFSCLVDFNQGWVEGAPALMMGAFKKDMKNGEKENFHALHDLGLFMGNVSVQATSMGIAIHQMAGIDFKKAGKEFNFPSNYHVATGIAIGYYGGDPETLPEDLQEEETKVKRERKPQGEFAFNGNFKN
ncbi:nitroreductase family protein [Marinirhabdus gelatinilytica]|uniref:Nitroreductase n=1 Tax=Marinirhabdus gelatinilytica TaxID=1703343 RepID=A0A370QA02_9FLAO|nr:nitroreductase family protein [Marinirhabdus gelatinilytica]RDK85211.1 nitroreductase [Marinirhabdus gelatinilytica]